MNRNTNSRFLFRVYSFLDKSFHYFDIYEYPHGIAGGVSEPEQFIGVLDKNGIKIFEGDIVKFKYLIGDNDAEEACGEVFFEDGVFLFDRKLMFSTVDNNLILHSLEVVGAVHLKNE